MHREKSNIEQEERRRRVIDALRSMGCVFDAIWRN